MIRIGTAKRLATKQTFPMEIIISLGLLCAINFYLYPEAPGFNQASPHPYWLVVLLVGTRYGFLGGMFSGLASAALFILLQALSIPDVSLIELSSYDVWGLPLYFVAVGIALGEIRETQIRSRQEVELERDEIKTSFERLEKQYNALNDVKQEIDSRIISQEQTVSTLYESAQSLRTLNEDEIYQSVLFLLRDHVDVVGGRIYMIEDNQLVLEGNMGKESAPPKTLPLDQGIIGEAIREDKTIAINESIESHPTNEEGLLVCAPIHNPEQDKIIGVLCIDDIPFIKLNRDTVKIVSLMADWCGASLSNAKVYENTKAKLITDDIIQAYTPDYFATRLQEEFSRSRRYKLPLSLLVLTPPQSESQDGSLDENVLISFSLAVKEVIRNIDLLFLHDNPGWFSLLLPNTPIEGAEIVARKISEKFDALQRQREDTTNTEGIKVGLADYQDTFDTHQDMVARAESALH